MSLEGRRHRSCTGKVKHLDWWTANEAIRDLTRRGRVEGRMNAYHCRFCLTFHIGHTRRQPERQSMNDADIEAMSRAKGLTAPRVTPAELRDNIVHTTIVKHIAESGQVLRWAVLTTRSGFAVTGRPSASVSSENDDVEIGERVAIDNATAELWPLMGYALRERLAREPIAHVKDNNQPGWLNIVETAPHVTLPVGTPLFGG